VAAAGGVPTLGLVFLVVALAITVTEATRSRGALLLLRRDHSRRAGGQRLTSSPLRLTLLSVLFALVAAGRPG
jgi:hypothetical protein